MAEHLPAGSDRRPETVAAARALRQVDTTVMDLEGLMGLMVLSPRDAGGGSDAFDPTALDLGQLMATAIRGGAANNPIDPAALDIAQLMQVEVRAVQVPGVQPAASMSAASAPPADTA